MSATLTSPVASNDLPALRNALEKGIISELEFRGEHTLNLTLEALPKALAICKEKLGYEMLLDISSLDHFGEDPRFEVVYELASLDDTRHLRLKAKVSEDEAVPTAVNLWAGADCRHAGCCFHWSCSIRRRPLRHRSRRRHRRQTRASCKTSGVRP